MIGRTRRMLATGGVGLLALATAGASTMAAWTGSVPFTGTVQVAAPPQPTEQLLVRADQPHSYISYAFYSNASGLHPTAVLGTHATEDIFVKKPTVGEISGLSLRLDPYADQYLRVGKGAASPGYVTTSILYPLLG